MYRTLTFSIGLADTAYLLLEEPVSLETREAERVKFPRVLTSAKSLRKALLPGKKAKLFGFGRRGKEKNAKSTSSRRNPHISQ